MPSHCFMVPLLSVDSEPLSSDQIEWGGADVVVAILLNICKLNCVGQAVLIILQVLLER